MKKIISQIRFFIHFKRIKAGLRLIIEAKQYFFADKTKAKISELPSFDNRLSAKTLLESLLFLPFELLASLIREYDWRDHIFLPLLRIFCFPFISLLLPFWWKNFSALSSFFPGVSLPDSCAILRFLRNFFFWV